VKANINFYHISPFPLRMRNVSDRICRKNENTHFVFSNFFFFENRAFYEKMWKNIVERGRPQMTIWRMHISCWIPKATNTHELCNTRCFSTSTMVLLTRLNVTFYVHCLSCLFGRPAVGSSFSLIYFWKTYWYTRYLNLLSITHVQLIFCLRFDGIIKCIAEDRDVRFCRLIVHTYTGLIKVLFIHQLVISNIHFAQVIRWFSTYYEVSFIYA